VYRVVAASNVAKGTTGRVLHVRPTQWLGEVTIK
jgi:hypothetical protein